MMEHTKEQRGNGSYAQRVTGLYFVFVFISFNLEHTEQPMLQAHGNSKGCFIPSFYKAIPTANIMKHPV
jgi:hypothetical protein